MSAFIFLLGLLAASEMPARSESALRQDSSPAPPDLFAAGVRPMLQKKCAPCHVPGGKMYARLPFDDPRVVASHSEGALRRLKGEDRRAFEEWMATLPRPTAPPR